MSFKSSIKYKLIIGKFLGVLFITLNIQNRPKFIDNMYPIPIIIAYLSLILIIPRIVHFFSPPPESVFNYPLFLLMSECYVVSILKWIYYFIRTCKFQELILKVNRYSKKFELKRKPLNKYLFILIIILYVFLNYGVNIYAEDDFSFYFLYSLPLEIGNYEQYLIYNINKELYSILRHIKLLFYTNNINGMVYVRLYDDYVKVKLIAEEANGFFGLPMLGSLFHTLIMLVSACFQFKVVDITVDVIYYTVWNYVAILLLRLIVTIYNWDMLVVLVCVTLNFLNKNY